MTGTLMPKTLIAAAVALLTAAPASTQDSDDWDFGHSADRDLTIAAVTFDNFGVAVRCLDDTLSVVISGVQASEGEQTIRFAMADEGEGDTSWIGSRNGSSLFSIWPRAIATDLQKGGRLSLGISDGERTRRLAVDLPSSPSAISRVFAACGRELTSGPTSDLPGGVELSGLVWSEVPQPQFPSGTLSEAGIAALSCQATDDGHLRNCLIESEFPEGGRFGRAATFGAHRTGRVRMADGSTRGMEGRRLSFTVRYNLSAGPPLPVTPSRIQRDTPATTVPPRGR